MPTGKIRWYDPERGYGFITGDDGTDVFLPASALPEGVPTVRKGTKVEYSQIEDRRGPQAMKLEVIKSGPSVVAATRPSPDDMATIVEDLIKLLDGAEGSLRQHRYPTGAEAHKLARMLRIVADSFDVEK